MTGLQKKKTAEVLNLKAWRIQQLVGISRALHRLFEAECNGYTREKRAYETWEVYDKDRELQMQNVDRWIKLRLRDLDRICKSEELEYYVQTDPRGCSLYVAREPLTSSNYSSRGMAIH